MKLKLYVSISDKSDLKKVFQYKMAAKTVCLTLGEKGSKTDCLDDTGKLKIWNYAMDLT